MAVAHVRASVEVLPPGSFFRRVGDWGAERAPDLVPEAVGELRSEASRGFPGSLRVWALSFDEWFCKVFSYFSNRQVLRRPFMLIFLVSMSMSMSMSMCMCTFEIACACACAYVCHIATAFIAPWRLAFSSFRIISGSFLVDLNSYNGRFFPKCNPSCLWRVKVYPSYPRTHFYIHTPSFPQTFEHQLSTNFYIHIMFTRVSSSDNPSQGVAHVRSQIIAARISLIRIERAELGWRRVRRTPTK